MSTLKQSLFGLFVPALVMLAGCGVTSNASSESTHVRTHYIAADEIAWDYAPTGVDEISGKPFAIPVGAEGVFSLNRTGFADANLKFTMNGYSFGNMPKMVMKKGDRVRWYVIAIGFGFNFHTPHWHGNTVLVNKQRTDVISIAPAQMITADMVPDNPGTWFFHCHVSDHMRGGMTALYQVNP